VADHGQPRSFLDIDDGVDVISSDGERVGTLEHVLADEEADIVEKLHEPSANPVVLEYGGEDSGGAREQKLRRAWDLISGRY
jgi:hypothetical protein